MQAKVRGALSSVNLYTELSNPIGVDTSRTMCLHLPPSRHDARLGPPGRPPRRSGSLGGGDEANLSAQPNSACTHTRVPAAIPDSGWSGRPGSTAREGAATSGTGKIERVGSLPYGRSAPPIVHAPTGVSRGAAVRSACLEPVLPHHGPGAARRWGSAPGDYRHTEGREGRSSQPHKEACPRMVSTRGARARPARPGGDREAGSPDRTDSPGGARRSLEGAGLGGLRVRKWLVGAVRAYQRFGGPLFGPACRFYPSCSEYAAQVIARDGVLPGGGRALWRVLRCTPFQRGGLDLP